MIGRIVHAVVIGALVGLGCLLLGMVLSSLNIPPVETVGDFLTQWCWVIGILVGLLTFFKGGPTVTL
jgi:hypothetical protein